MLFKKRHFPLVYLVTWQYSSYKSRINARFFLIIGLQDDELVPHYSLKVTN